MLVVRSAVEPIFISNQFGLLVSSDPSILILMGPSC